MGPGFPPSEKNPKFEALSSHYHYLTNEIYIIRQQLDRHPSVQATKLRVIGVQYSINFHSCCILALIACAGSN
jgi:hypothetical protein